MSFYLTTPIYYVNDVPHIGHAYTTIACDVMARYQRLCGESVRFLTGTDEHGQKVEKSAAAQQIAPLEFASLNSEKFRALVQDPARADGGSNRLGISNDDFIRTTEARHRAAAQAFWKRLEARGMIYLSSYAGWYSVRDEAFYDESELVSGNAPTGAPVEWVEEPSYFFKLSAFQEPLLALYRDHPEFIYPNSRLNEVKRFVEGGLTDLSISRTTFRWGIPVPDAPEHVMYVWLDALTNYLTALGFPDESAPLFTEFWPHTTHVVGKDIVRFHAVYWPAFLMAADLPIPKRIVAHGWWTNEGQKISKSLGNVIDPLALIDEFGLDPVRYFLLREVPFGQDGNYAREQMIARMNAELANTIGNLAQRTLSFIHKNAGAVVPLLHAETDAEKRLLALCYNAAPYHSALRDFAFHSALEHVVSLAMQANLYIDQNAPWSLKKSGDLMRMETVLYTLCEVIRVIAILLQPFVPTSARAMLAQLGCGEASLPLSFACVDHALTSGTALPVPSAIFPRFQA